MVYEWESHKDVLKTLYVYEKKTIEEIITHMRIQHSFTPRQVSYLLELFSGLPRRVFSPAVHKLPAPSADRPSRFPGRGRRGRGPAWRFIHDSFSMLPSQG